MQARVVVITGASSGIGRATALAFARTGAAVVLGARDEHALTELAGECERAGGMALPVATDVTDEQAVTALAERAVERFGALDVWVNNAGVTVLGRFEDIPTDVFRRVLDTNVLGYVYGARAALARFREQGRGVLINVSSVVGKVPQPYASPYVMSKHAIRALGAGLRQELVLGGDRDIHVCTLMPATVDTPLFQHAANFTKRNVVAMPPVYQAERVAETIVSLSSRPRREVLVGASGRLTSVARAVMPGRSERLFAKQVDRGHLGDEHAAVTSGNVFTTMPPTGQVGGGWSAAARGRTLRIAAGVLAVGVPVAAGILARETEAGRKVMSRVARAFG